MKETSSTVAGAPNSYDPVQLRAQEIDEAAKTRIVVQCDPLGVPGPAQADLCRDFFRRAVALEFSFFEAAYADGT
jgi:hypothetical protein